MARISRKTLTAAVVVALLLIAAAAVWWLRRPPDGFLTAIAPIDGRHAVFTMRANYDKGPSRAWIGVIDADEDRIVWSRELPGETYSTDAGSGLTLSEQQVTVKVSDTPDSARILAFDLATGEQRWQSAPIELQPSEYPLQLHGVSGDRPHDDGEQVFHGDHDRATARLVARDSATGATQWSYQLPQHGVRELWFLPRVALIRGAGWTALQRTDGAVVREVGVHADACLDAEGRFVVWDRDELVRIDFRDPAALEQREPLPSLGYAMDCGTHAGRLVFTVALPSDSLAQRRVEMVAVSGSPPQIEWRLDLGHWEPSTIARDRDNNRPEATPNRGTLSDFVPLVVSNYDTEQFKLVMIDVGRGVLAWESPPHDELLHYQVYRGSLGQYFASNRARIIALDGNTGEITAAVDVGHDTSRSFHAVDGRLWIYVMTWHRMNELAWAILDGRTLELLARGNESLRTTDVTAQTIAWLAPGGR